QQSQQQQLEDDQLQQCSNQQDDLPASPVKPLLLSEQLKTLKQKAKQRQIQKQQQKRNQQKNRKKIKKNVTDNSLQHVATIGASSSKIEVTKKVNAQFDLDDDDSEFSDDGSNISLD